MLPTCLGRPLPTSGPWWWRPLCHPWSRPPGPKHACPRRAEAHWSLSVGDFSPLGLRHARCMCASLDERWTQTLLSPDGSYFQGASCSASWGQVAVVGAECCLVCSVCSCGVLRVLCARGAAVAASGCSVRWSGCCVGAGQSAVWWARLMEAP